MDRWAGLHDSTERTSDEMTHGRMDGKEEQGRGDEKKTRGKGRKEGGAAATWASSASIFTDV